MKRTKTSAMLACILAVTFLISCAAINEYIATPTGELIVKKAGRIAGITVGYENVDKINEMIEQCDAVLAEKDGALQKIGLEKLYAYIYARYGNNAQTTILISEATELIGIALNGDELSFLDGYNFAAMDMFVKAFRDGLSLATPKHVRKYTK